MFVVAIIGCVLIQTAVQAAGTTKKQLTTQKPCTSADCALHDGKIKDFLTSASLEDFSSLLTDSALIALLGKGNIELGDVSFKCGRLIFSSHNQANFEEAAIVCAKRKMQLLTIEDGARNLECLVPKVEQMTAEQQTNETLMLNGIWAEWLRDAGLGMLRKTTFLFGYKKMTWTESLKMCCKLGMKPIKVTDQLLDALNAESKGSSFKIYETVSQDNATANQEFIKTSLWTAGTRQGCAGQYRFCLHDDMGPWDSRDKFWDMVNPRDDGSCLVIDRQYAKANAPFGVRQVQCSAPSANFACQLDNKLVADFVKIDDEEPPDESAKLACEQPACPNQGLCEVNRDFVAEFENGEHLLLKPYLLGQWNTSCGVQYLIPPMELSWPMALDYCCSLGMQLLTVQSYEKLMCLDQVLPLWPTETEFYNVKSNLMFWTSGTNNGCKNRRYRWCSSEMKDFLKPSVNLYNKTMNFDFNGFDSFIDEFSYCVIVTNMESKGPMLGIDECSMTRSFICETRVPAKSHLQEVYNECRLTHRVGDREINKFDTLPLDKYSYKMKCLGTCIAELLGLLYDSGKFWEERVEAALKKVKDVVQVEDFRSLMKKFSMSDLKKATDNLDARKMMMVEQSKEAAWKSTLLINEALDKFWSCNQWVVQRSKEECSFLHNFIRCFTNDSTSLEKFWKKNLHNVFKSSDYMRTTGKTLKQVEELVETTGADPQAFVEPINKLSFTNEMMR